MIRLGARGSKLSRTQATWVADALRAEGAVVELVWIETQGDVRGEPLQQIGGQGLFTKEIQRALLDGRADLAVHSLKDLPTAVAPGLCLAATPAREQVRDVLLVRDNSIGAWGDLPQGALIGTGSARRQAQLLHRRPDLQVREIRGNVETRLRKLDAGDYDAIVLAEAGLRRLGVRRSRLDLPVEWMLPAIGQGALGLECRAGDDQVLPWLEKVNDIETLASVTAERALLAELEGGCLAPVAAWVRRHGQDMVLDAAVLSSDGRRRITTRGSVAGLPADWGEERRQTLKAAVDLGCRAAADLLSQGAADLLAR